MPDQIISRDAIRARGRTAFERGLSRDHHYMNWHSAARVTWLQEYDRLATEAKKATA